MLPYTFYSSTPWIIEKLFCKAKQALDFWNYWVIKGKYFANITNVFLLFFILVELEKMFEEKGVNFMELENTELDIQ